MNKGLQVLTVVCVLVCLAEFCRGQDYSSGSIQPRPMPRRCGPICRMGCPNGFVIVRGCPICKCKPVRPIFPPIKPTKVVCPPGSRPTIRRRTCFTSQWRIDSPQLRMDSPQWRMGSRPSINQCGRRGFCQPARAGGPGLCCTRRRVIPTPTPGRCPRIPRNPMIRCVRFQDDCNAHKPCHRGRICCPTVCGRACSRVSSGIKY